MTLANRTALVLKGNTYPRSLFTHTYACARTHAHTSTKEEEEEEEKSKNEEKVECTTLSLQP